MVALQDYKSVMAEGHSADTSGKFSFIPTTRVVDIIEKQGWYPAKILEKRARKPEKIGFQAHVVRFRREEDMNQQAIVGEYIPEIVLKNAHDGTSTFQIMAGLYRFVCKNGMVVADSTFETYKIRHTGFQDQNVIDAVFSVVKTTPKILDRVNQFKAIILNVDEQKAYAESALVVKYGAEGLKFQNEINKFNYGNLIAPTRTADTIVVKGYGWNTLWNTFNILQEKLVEKGGRFGVNLKGNSQSAKVRGIKSVSENIRINQGLWMLSEKMCELKGGM